MTQNLTLKGLCCMCYFLKCNDVIVEFLKIAGEKQRWSVTGVGSWGENYIHVECCQYFIDNFIQVNVSVFNAWNFNDCRGSESLFIDSSEWCIFEEFQHSMTPLIGLLCSPFFNSVLQFNLQCRILNGIPIRFTGFLSQILFYCWSYLTLNGIWLMKFQHATVLMGVYLTALFLGLAGRELSSFRIINALYIAFLGLFCMLFSGIWSTASIFVKLI